MAVAKAAIAAAQQHDTLARADQVGEEAFLVVGENLRPDRHAQHDVAPLRTRLVRPGAAAPVLCPEMLLVAVIDQRVEIVGGEEDDVAALAALAAIGPAEFDEFLAAKAHRPAPAVTALQIDLALVKKFHVFSEFGPDINSRHPRESGGPGQPTSLWPLDSRFRGNDGCGGEIYQP